MPRGISRLLPATAWLRTYETGWLRGDLIAGFVLAAYLLPAGIGDASLANLPPQVGLYACIFPALIFWLLCSSRQTVVTVTSAISILMGASLGTLAGGNEQRFAELASCTALLVAAIALLAWLVKAGSIVNFISESVMLGFKSGVALYLGSTQLPKLFGFKGSHGDFWERMHYFIKHIGNTNYYALVFGLCALTVLILGKIFLKNRPLAILVVIAAIAASSFWNLSTKGVVLIGVIPQGLPRPTIPPINWRDINELLPLALACFLLGAVESAAIGRMFARKYRYRFDSSQEFLSLAASNLFSGLGQGYPVSGGMSQSLVNESANARTPLSGLFAGLIMIGATIFLTGSLRNLPQSVLAAIVLIAISGLFKPNALIRLWKFHRREFVVAAAAMIGVLGSGLLRGVLVGAIISLVQLIHRTSRPHVAFLGRVPGTRRFSDLDRHPENEIVAGALIFRPEASLLYFNVEYVCATVRQKLAIGVTELVICDLGSAPGIDLQSAETLTDFGRELSSVGIRMRVVEARASVRDLLRSAGDESVIGSLDRNDTVADAIETLAPQVGLLAASSRTT